MAACEETPRARAQIWYCKHCPKKLGVVRGMQIEIIHAQRRITANLPCVQVCDSCGATNVWLAGATRISRMEH